MPIVNAHLNSLQATQYTEIKHQPNFSSQLDFIAFMTYMCIKYGGEEKKITWDAWNSLSSKKNPDEKLEMTISGNGAKTFQVIGAENAVITELRKLFPNGNPKPSEITELVHKAFKNG